MRYLASRARVAVPCMALALLLAAARPAQGVTFLEQIERLRVIYGLLLDYRPGLAPLPSGPTALELGLELIPRPAVDHTVGAKHEPVDPPGIIPRVRARFRSRGYMLGATASPPVEVGGYTATWSGAEAGVGGRGGRTLTELRVFAIQGKITGPITDATRDDTYTFRNGGLDARAGVALGPLHPYLGLGQGRMRSELDISADGAHDESESGYKYWFFGMSWASGPAAFTLEQHFSEHVLSHFILSINLRW